MARITYSNFILTVIAMALIFIAFQNAGVIPKKGATNINIAKINGETFSEGKWPRLPISGSVNADIENWSAGTIPVEVNR